MIPLAEIKPYWRNPRQNDDAVDAVATSIQRYGMNQPLVLDSERVIIAGHTRYRALRQLGADRAPCIVADLPADKAKEYRLADNATGEIATWDTSALVAELREVSEIEALNPMFPAMDLDGLLARSASAGQEERPGVTQDKIDERAGQLATQFEDSGVSDMVTITCPGCGEDMEVSRSALAKARG